MKEAARPDTASIVLRWSVAAIAVVVVTAAAVSETAGFQARRLALDAQSTASDPAPAETLELARRALALDPDNPQALYLQAVKLKELDRLDELRERLPRLLGVHPNQATVLRLAGEQAYLREDFAEAADLLWESMWINPTPSLSPAGYWRMTMVVSDQAGRRADARMAAYRALALMPQDNYLTREDRQDLLRDVAAVFIGEGWTLAGAHLIRVAEMIR